jgi:hypothetical protein
LVVVVVGLVAGLAVVVVVVVVEVNGSFSAFVVEVVELVLVDEDEVVAGDLVGGANAGDELSVGGVVGRVPWTE